VQDVGANWWRIINDGGALVLKISIVYSIEIFRDAFNKVQETGSNRDFGTTEAAKMYFSGWAVIFCI
jgi:hypothetical protein